MANRRPLKKNPFRGGPTAGSRRWQYAFVAGAASCLVFSVVALGPTVFTTIVGVSTLIIGALNGLLSSFAGRSPRETWARSVLGRSLKVTGFLKAATTVVWLVTIGLATYRAVRFYSEMRALVVEGYVLTPSGEAADNAVVTLSLGGRTETTVSSAGSFSFKGIDLARPSPSLVELEARWKNSQARASVDVTTGRRKRVVLRLAGIPPFRLSYFVIAGHGIDFLAEGKVDKRWEERLAGQPFIVPNEVFSHLRKLREEFSARFDETYFYVTSDSRSQQNTAYEDVARANLGKRFFVGGWEPRMAQRAVAGASASI